jgi:hypothetical protein
MRSAEKSQPPSGVEEPEPRLASGVELAGGPLRSSRAASEATQVTVEQTCALPAGPLRMEPSEPLPELVARACAGDRAALQLLARQELPRVELGIISCSEPWGWSILLSSNYRIAFLGAT